MENYLIYTKIPGVLLIKKPTFEDERGFFREYLKISDLENKISFNPIQFNHSRSEENVLRGIHSAPWYKLIYIVKGNVQEVIVDLRSNSKTFKEYISFNLGEENKMCVLIPPNCGNSFLALTQTDYIYFTDQYFAPNKETSIRWDDPDININWAVKKPKLSIRDKNNKSIKELFNI